ncbi:MAG: hypothetical protein HC903_04715 [Methylacidiphilales bacterium]|nr:hypothetical protein [Candidatus Methylacidiphilales bacterium]NJR16838.1 hypothetical protein [Calothrix sp. CSU_2_0]
MNVEQTPQCDGNDGKLSENATPLQKMQYEVQEELMKCINNSQMKDIFEKHGLTEEAISFEVLFDLHQMRSQHNTAIADTEVQSALKAIPATQIKLASCCWSWICRCCVQC